MLALRHPLGTTIRVPLKVYLSSDHISPGTGLTVAVVISKNGGAFANPNAGATNATEVGLGWYYVDLDATDMGTLGPVVVRGTSATADPAEVAMIVVPVTNGGFTALPAVAAEAAGGLYTRGSGAGQINQPSNGVIDTAFSASAVAEPTGVPSFTTTTAQAMLARLYQTLINGLVVDSNTNKLQLKNAAGTVIWEKDLTDAGGIYEESGSNAP